MRKLIGHMPVTRILCGSITVGTVCRAKVSGDSFVLAVVRKKITFGRGLEIAWLLIEIS